MLSCPNYHVVHLAQKLDNMCIRMLLVCSIVIIGILYSHTELQWQYNIETKFSSFNSLNDLLSSHQLCSDNNNVPTANICIASGYRSILTTFCLKNHLTFYCKNSLSQCV